MQQVGNTQSGLSLRTSPDCSQPTVDLQWGDALTRWPKQGRWSSNGQHWTRSIGESPSDGAECLLPLVSILQSPHDVASKYFLSARAAEGILRRATRRGKKLPQHLEAALQAVVQSQTPTE